MGIFSAIAGIFGSGNKSNEVDSRIAVKGDVAAIPDRMITPDYRPRDGVYISSAANILREWEARNWALSPDDLIKLKEMHKTLENYEKLSKDYGKELGDLSKIEAKLVKTVTGTIPKIAGSNFAQYSHNQKLNSDMDKISAEYQKNIALRQAEVQQIQQNLADYKARIQQRKQGMRGGQ